MKLNITNTRMLIKKDSYENEITIDDFLNDDCFFWSDCYFYFDDNCNYFLIKDDLQVFDLCRYNGINHYYTFRLSDLLDVLNNNGWIVIPAVMDSQYKNNILEDWEAYRNYEMGV